MRLLFLCLLISSAFAQTLEVASVDISLSGEISKIKNVTLDCSNSYQPSFQSEINFTGSPAIYMSQYGKASPREATAYTDGLATCSGVALLSKPYQDFVQGDLLLAHNWVDVQDLFQTTSSMMAHLESEEKNLEHAVFLISYRGNNFVGRQSGYTAAICSAGLKNPDAKILLIRSFKQDDESFNTYDNLEIKRLNAKTIQYNIERHNSAEDIKKISVEYGLDSRSFETKIP